MTASTLPPSVVSRTALVAFMSLNSEVMDIRFGNVWSLRSLPS